jgi:hypothetical protein
MGLSEKVDVIYLAKLVMVPKIAEKSYWGGKFYIAIYMVAVDASFATAMANYFMAAGYLQNNEYKF